MTSEEARLAIVKEPLQLNPLAQAIYDYLVENNYTLDLMEARCLAYAAAEHLNEGYYDEPEYLLCGEGGRFCDAL